MLQIDIADTKYASIFVCIANLFQSFIYPKWKLQTLSQKKLNQLNWISTNKKLRAFYSQNRSDYGECKCLRK